MGNQNEDDSNAQTLTDKKKIMMQFILINRGGSQTNMTTNFSKVELLVENNDAETYYFVTKIILV